MPIAHIAQYGFRHLMPLAQMLPGNPWDEPPAAPAPPVKPTRAMSFSDLQQGMHAVNTGQVTDNTFRNGILTMIALVAVVVLVIHFRQRHKLDAAPDNVGQLGRELGRLVKFPLGTRIVLWWVARFNQLPFASLLISGALFDKAVKAWAAHPTFNIIRRWGHGRLQQLRPNLFKS